MLHREVLPAASLEAVQNIHREFVTNPKSALSEGRSHSGEEQRSPFLEKKNKKILLFEKD